MTEPTSLLVGRSNQIQQIRSTIQLVADTDLPVVISGETGSGKEVVARELHRFGGSRGDLVCVNCANLVPSLADSQLFGHERGAFTDAKTRCVGYVGEANHGTLFLDEIAELEMPLQGKLLRVLETKKYRPLGGTGCQRSSFRLIAATSDQLLNLVQERRFRSDLYYRFGPVSIHLPPLRERPEDILELAEFFLRGLESTRGVAFSAEAVARLQDYSWPGNVRQLKSVVETASVFSTDGVVAGSLIAWLTPRHHANGDLPNVPGSPSIPTLEEAVRNAEVEVIQRALAATSGDRKEAARLLEVSTATLYRRIEGLPD